jgi:predicted metal-dependent RNase
MLLCPLSELRQYFLQHRQDKMALQAYLDRLNTRPRNVITTLDDPEFDVKVQAAIRQQMQGRKTQGESAV